MKLEECLAQCRWVQRKLGQLYKAIRKGQVDERGTLYTLVACMQSLSRKNPIWKRYEDDA